MSPEEVNVRVGNFTLRVPICANQATTQAIADTITERLKAIEARSTRVDTQAFALTAAFEFAAELQRTQSGQEQDNKELLVALDAIATRMQDLLEELGDT